MKNALPDSDVSPKPGFEVFLFVDSKNCLSTTARCQRVHDPGLWRAPAHATFNFFLFFHVVVLWFVIQLRQIEAN